MSKVRVDSGTCVGCGLCEQVCPEVFQVQGDGVAHTKTNTCPSHNLQEVAQQCPVSAIQVS
jgi:ferredoxin